MATLNRHVAKGNIFGAVISGKVLISKQSLIGHLTTPDVVRKVATEQLKKLLAEYSEQESDKEQRNGLKMCLRLFI